MADEKTSLATAIHRACDLLVERSHYAEAMSHAQALIEAANEILDQGTVRCVEDRLAEFAAQMVVPLGAPIIADGAVFPSFRDSPYSGAENAARPKSVQYQRVGDEVHAEVLLGPSFEGAPGRAHGGTTAAVFDDVMGATQRVTGLSGYTKTLHVTYLGPLPTDEAVQFRAFVVEEDESTFSVDAEALHHSHVVATARGIFTKMTPERFTSSQ